MVNSETIRQRLQSAATSHDPNGMAAAVAIPLIANAKSGREPKTHSPKPLMMGNADYGGLLASLLDAHSAAESVSTAMISLSSYGRPGHLLNFVFAN